MVSVTQGKIGYVFARDGRDLPAGQTLADNLKTVTIADPEIIRPLDRPISPGPAIAVLKGSLAPESAIVKLGIRGSRLDTFDGPARV